MKIIWASPTRGLVTIRTTLLCTLISCAALALESARRGAALRYYEENETFDDSRSARTLLRTRHQLSAYTQRVQPSRLGFIHIPKCGGTSVWAALEEDARKAQLRVESKDDKLSAGSLDVVGRSHYTYEAMISNWVYDDGKALERSRPGHGRPSNTHFVVFLREPKSRLISHLRYTSNFCKKGLPNHHICPFIQNRSINELTSMISDGYFVKFLSTHSRRSSGTELLDCCSSRAELEIAKANMAQSMTVGILEDIETSIFVLKCKVHWFKGEIGHRNAIYRDMESEYNSIPDEIMNMATALDSELYQFAKKIMYIDYKICSENARLKGI